MKVVVAAFAGLEAALLVGQITTLVSTYWTSWDLRFNWTQTGGEFSRRPHADGQLLSQGHAGLWSRCVKIYGTGQHSNDSEANRDRCLHNYDEADGSVRYTFGKACKTATAGLCVGEAAVTSALLVVVMVTTFWQKGPRFLHHVPLPLLLVQGAIAFTIPLTYLSGNMAELISQLSATYGLLLVVHMETWYTHDWAFWTQVSLGFVWIVATGIHVLLSLRWPRKQRSMPSDKNGRKKSEAALESTELEALRSGK